MTKRRLKLTGKRFGRLVVIGISHKDKHGRWLWDTKCDCSVSKSILGNAMNSGLIKSCGCLHKENRFKHGMIETTIYSSWKAMKARCLNPKSKSYHNYGNRGIMICERWLNSFENFLADMGEKSEGLTLERINNDKGYYKENCKWATRKEQANNRRLANKKYIIIDFNGCKLTISQWAKKLNIKRATLKNRLHLGWPIERALTEKAHRREAAQ